MPLIIYEGPHTIQGLYGKLTTYEISEHEVREGPFKLKLRDRTLEICTCAEIKEIVYDDGQKQKIIIFTETKGPKGKKILSAENIHDYSPPIDLAENLGIKE